MEKHLKMTYIVHTYENSKIIENPFWVVFLNQVLESFVHCFFSCRYFKFTIIIFQCALLCAFSYNSEVCLHWNMVTNYKTIWDVRKGIPHISYNYEMWGRESWISMADKEVCCLTISSQASGWLFSQSLNIFIDLLCDWISIFIDMFIEIMSHMFKEFIC